jgi:glycogen operon protein
LRRDVLTEAAPTLTELLDRAHVEWHGVELRRPDWSDASRSIAMSVRSVRGRFLFHAIFNAYWEPLTFQLPPIPPGDDTRWRRAIDTALASPDDLRMWSEAPAIDGATYVVQPRSVVVMARALDEESPF